MSTRLFEQGSDTTPLTTHKVAWGLAGNTTKNSLWSTVITWLNTVLQIPASQVTEETDLNFVTDAEELLLQNTETYQAIENIGVWDMDATASVYITHGVTDFKDIIGVTGVIYNDGLSQSYIIASYNQNDIQVEIINSTQIKLTRSSGGDFDNTSFDDGVINRGKLLIEYIP